MAKPGGKIGDRFGDNMLESMASNTMAHTPHATPGGISAAERNDGTKAFREARTIALRKILPDPDQPRKEFEPGKLEELANSLRDRGLLQPIRVRWADEHKSYLVVAGERRYRAAKLLGWQEISCVVASEGQTASGVLIDQLVENCLRDDLKPIEQANAFQALMNAEGWTAVKLGAELNISNSTISRALALLKLPEAIQDRVISGELPASTAAEIARIEDPEEQAAFADEARTMTRNQVKAKAQAKVKAVEKPSAPKRAGRPPTKFSIAWIHKGVACTITGPIGLSRSQVMAALEKGREEIDASTSFED